MKNKIFFLSRLVSGVLLVVFGLNGFLQFMPMPQPTPEMGQYLGALAKSGFIFPIVSVLQIIVGLAYLGNKFVALSSIIILPIIINAFLAHLFLDINGIGASLILLILISLLMIKYKEQYSEILKP